MGLFDSDILSKDTLIGRMGKAEEVAKVLCFLLSDNASYVTGGESFTFGFSVNVVLANLCSTLECRWRIFGLLIVLRQPSPAQWNAFRATLLLSLNPIRHLTIIAIYVDCRVINGIFSRQMQFEA
jgi:hypothetical protein